MEKRLIDILAEKHNDWGNMAKSFGISKEDANELVQQMYIRITDYVVDVKRILFNESEINTYYIYVTLRNLYLSKYHSIDLKIVIVAIMTSIFCQIGDLTFSFLKRKARLQDTGKILPGHGGILDRLDGILLGVPLGFVTFVLIY